MINIFMHRIKNIIGIHVYILYKISETLHNRINIFYYKTLHM
jgi:hypothetical protein